MTTPNLFEQITELRQAGLTLKEIADDLGMSIASVWRYDNSRGQKVTPEEIDRKHTRALHRQGLSVPDIAKALGLDVYWVHDVIHKPKTIKDS
jgi:hypothetical protein